MNNIHLCQFTASIDEMSRSDQRDPVAVLKVLRECKRFSIFESTANQSIASTIDLLIDRKLIETRPLGFPWSEATITPAGEAVLTGGPLPDKPDNSAGFVQIARNVYVHRTIARDFGMARL